MLTVLECRATSADAAGVRVPSCPLLALSLLVTVLETCFLLTMGLLYTILLVIVTPSRLHTYSGGSGPAVVPISGAQFMRLVFFQKTPLERSDDFCMFLSLVLLQNLPPRLTLAGQ